MPDNEEAALGRRIVKSYQASGIPAKRYRGKILVNREKGWEGPLDPYELQTTYLDEIGRIEQAVRVALIEAIDRMDERLRRALGDDRQMWLSLMSPAAFAQLGFGEHKARLYMGVACQLDFKGNLWI